MAMRHVIAVRHAPTEAEGVCVGNGDVPCTVSAQDAAAKILLAVSGRRFACVWSSSLERCRGPATLIARALGLPLCVDERLKEIDLGQWQLRTWSSIEATEPEQYKSWLEHWLTQTPPGGELPYEMLGRVEEWWRHLAPGIHLLISHAGVNRALRVLMGGKTWTEAMGGPVPHLQAESFRQPVG
jgi:alpha-ribazole phosphatase